MNDQVPDSESEFVLRRLSGSFTQFVGQMRDSVPLMLLVGVVVALIALRLLRTSQRAKNPKAGGWYPLAFWLGILAVVGTFCYRLMYAELGNKDGTVGLGTEFAFANNALWYGFIIAILVLGLFYVVWQYRKDARGVRWWAVPLAFLRGTVYVLLAAAFLLPAKQTWVRTEKSSKVVVIIDVSPSMSQHSDELATPNGPKPKTRMDKVLDVLTDGNIALLAKLREKNPVTVYRFGSRLDEEAQTFDKGKDGNWLTADWDIWLRYDFKPWLLKGLSPAGQEIAKRATAWGADVAGTADWANGYAKAPETEIAPPELVGTDREKLLDNRAKLEKRVDITRSIALGTNVPDSLLSVVNRESTNMVQGIVVFSDGRSNLGSASAISELRERATREKIPVFTIAVGETRETVSIVLSDVQAPDRAAPDEPFKVIVEADGFGLTKQEVEVRLSLYMPTKDPKRDAASHELTMKLIFEPGDPPHGTAEFTIDPDKLPEELTEESKKAGKKKQMKSGQWAVVARINRDKREAFAQPEHISPPRIISVLDKPTRVLLWASGPTREYQTLRTLLVRETQASRAELSILLQNEGGAAGSIVQDIAPERMLTRFPTRLDTTNKATDKPEDKFYNLNEYDLIIAFDPDWSELSDEQIKNLQSWVDNLGGGFIYVAEPIHTFQLARQDEGGRFKPLLDILPVIPDDVILIKTRPFPRSPRRVTLKPLQDFDVLRLDDSKPEDPIAGWEKFFSGNDKITPEILADKQKYLNPQDGFYKFYPVKLVKPGAAVLMEYLDTNETGELTPRPFLVTTQPARGRTAFLGSGEIYRLRATDLNFYDRFWIKLTRYIAGNRDARASRGRVLVSKEFTSGSPLRVQARLLSPNGSPYPVNELNTKFKVTQFASDGTTKIKDIGIYPMAPKKSVVFDGYYGGQVLADPRLFPPGDFRYKVTVDVPDSPGDTLDGEFRITKSDPELDNTKPDLSALAALASPLSDVPLIKPGSAAYNLILGNNTTDKTAKLAFKLSESDKITAIPEAMDFKRNEYRNKGPVEDLWDKPLEGVTTFGESALTRWMKPGSVSISWLLLVLVACLSTEWLIRKLLRLA